MHIDDTDRRILRQLQADPEESVTILAARANVTGATFARRVEKMRENSVILAIRDEINWQALGYTVEVSLRFTLDKTEPRAFDQFIAAARVIPEVILIGTFLGQVDVRLLVIARDMADYQRVYRDKILTLPHIADIEALMHVASIKERQEVPL
jgi:Lrp/AsnC family transcriptional regulator